MATRVTVELPSGEESWIDISNNVRKAVMDEAIENNTVPSEAFESVLGIPKERFEQSDDEENGEENGEENDEENDGESDE